jgi:hypothetical protein
MAINLRIIFGLPAVAVSLGSGPLRAEFTAYNDIVTGPATHANTTGFRTNGTTSGLLKDIASGNSTPVTLSVSEVGVNHEGAASFPAAGTDAGEIFLGFIDFTEGNGNSLALSGGDTYTYSFTGMSPGSRYEFAGTACRGNNSYTNRWTLVTLQGADSFAAAHSSGSGVVTAGLAANQVAIWVGANHNATQGYIAQWTDIMPGADGAVSVVCQQYSGATPGVGSGTATGSKGYGLNCLRLKESFIVGQPSVRNIAATDLTAAGARVGGEVTEVGDGIPSVTLYWGDEDGGGNSAGWDHVVPLGVQGGSFDQIISGLSPATTYYFRFFAQNATAGVWALPTESFTSLALPPVIEHGAVTNLLATSATVHGSIIQDGGDAPSVTLFYGAADGGTSPGSWAASEDLGVQGGAVEAALSGLSDGTTYFFRYRAVNSGGTAWSGTSGSFSTPVVTLPVVENRPAEGITGITAVLGGEVVEVGGDVPTVTIYYGRADGGTVKANWEASVPGGRQSGEFSRFVVNLEPEATYHFRVLATNAAGDAWASSSFSFMTPAYTPPTIVINEIHYEEDDTTLRAEFIEICNLSASRVNVSGWSLSNGVQFIFPDETTIEGNGYLVIAESPAVMQGEFGLAGALGPWTGKLSNDGETVRLRDLSWNLIDEVDYKGGFPWPSVGKEVGSPPDSPSIQLMNPVLENELGGSWRSARPTPGFLNQIFVNNAPPQTRKVRHLPEQPGVGEGVLITAQVTDPHGVASVKLEYQVVAPGNYVPGFLAKATSLLLNQPNAPLVSNPAYTSAANWTAVPMRDDGAEGDVQVSDGVYSVALPGRVSRTLVRYRIVVEDVLGAAVRVPYSDDPGLNFAYFCYDGVPDYVAGSRSVLGAPHTYPAAEMSSVPVYHLLTNDADFSQCVAYSGGNQISRSNYDARSAYNWTGTFVYNGKVYDHMGYRLRQRNARYSGSGKRSFKFRFNRGHYIQLHDEEGKAYPQKWRTLSTHKMRGSRGNHTWGLEQAANHVMWSLMDVPASETHWGHFRVVKGTTEQPPGGNGQYLGDFYGLLLVMEEFDKRFLDARGLEPGNLYKLISSRTNGKDVQRYQAPDAVSNASDFSNIINQLRSNKSDAWLHQHVNYDEWNRYHAVVDAVRHYDVRPNTGEHLKNRAYYFEPAAGSPLGKLWLLPWDSDTSWGPNWNDGLDFAKDAIWSVGPGFERPVFRLNYKNTIREMRDLMWTEEQIDLLLESHVAKIAALVPADRDRWTSAVSTPGTGSQSTPTIESVMVDMKRFAFDGGSWTGGNDGNMEQESRDSGLSGQQGRDAYLDWLGSDTAIPNQPTGSYSGEPGFPQGGIRLSSSAFSDPQGAGSFGAMEFRVAEIADALGKAEMEWNAEWESGEISTFTPEIVVPSAAVRVGRIYRGRVRHQDSTGRWSHWSAPLEFTVTAPDVAIYVQDLMVSEVMYHPGPPTAGELAVDPTWTADEFEWIEIMNVGTEALDLSELRLTKGVEFDFVNGTKVVIAPGERLVVVENLLAFNARYGFAETPAFVVGQYAKRFSNSGELVRIAYGAGTVVREFSYLDLPPWPVGADGTGPSLELVDPAARPDHQVAANWRASGAPMGTPGSAPGGFAGDPFADDDGDGVVALIEYGLGTSDSVPGGVPATVVRTEGGGIVFEVPRNEDATDVLFAFEISSDLLNWSEIPFVEWVGPGVAKYETMTVPVRLFGRVRVEIP